MQETRVQSLCWEDVLEKGMAALFRILAWRIPWTEEPGGQKSQTRLKSLIMDSTFVLLKEENISPVPQKISPFYLIGRGESHAHLQTNHWQMEVVLVCLT